MKLRRANGTRGDNPQNGSRRTDLAGRIRSAIVAGDFDLGEALSEEALAGALGVSRTPIREALRLLQTEGLVIVVPKSGTYVFDPGQAEISELCDYRAMLEVKAAVLAFKNARSTVAPILHDNAIIMREAMQRGDASRYSEADGAFHATFFQYCGNRYLSEAYEMCLGIVSALRTHLASASPGEPQRSFTDHEHIVAMFADGGSERALTQLLEKHILRTRENYVRAIVNRRRVFDGESRVDRMRRKLGISALQN